MSFSPDQAVKRFEESRKGGYDASTLEELAEVLAAVSVHRGSAADYLPRLTTSFANGKICAVLQGEGDDRKIVRYESAKSQSYRPESAKTPVSETIASNRELALA